MNPVRSLLLAGSQSAWLSRQATRNPIVRRAVSRFMPGETLDEALTAAGSLQGQGLGTILTQLGENTTSEAEAERVVRHYLEVLDRVRATSLDAEVSVKLTQLGLDLSPSIAFDNTSRIVSRAAALDNRVWIDMEATPYTDATLGLFRRLRERHENVGVCLQTYLRRTPADLESLLPLGPAIRLVKGAYREPAHLVFPRMQDVSDTFYALSERLLTEDARKRGAHLTAGTHDGVLIRRVEALVRATHAGPDDCEFALLYGIQRGEQARLAAAGHRTRVLISYGSHWFPWYMRRLAERPANLWFVVRNVFGR